ncbi:MAG: glycosyltransferase family 2 protein [Proteobacteria bacterium]|nr:glycosyltransferase family 2 protein [Pseudomonadota bacterium]MBU1649208.1 glycosyltransferase family 2 protein [Pseudomonadota bacterium]
MNRPQCSVIIVSYNNFPQTTGPCLQSLAREKSALEIIVIDNHSDQGTQDALRAAAGQDSRIKLILQETNGGYSKGNNTGAREASSDLLILLNSDTEVPPGAIPRLVELMTEHPDWSMLGPVSNQTGNDQQIHTKGTTVQEILDEGAVWCAHSHDCHYPTDILSFFCVVIRRDVYNQLNGLDEEFGLGYYEDTDFNYRAVKTRMKLMITEDVFVYHRGSGSFSKTSAAVRKMVKRNKKLFRKKQGHGHNAAHWRLKNLAAMAQYSAPEITDAPLADLRYKFNNRQTMARKLLPNSPIKRFFYLRRLKAIEKKFLARISTFGPTDIQPTLP